MSVESEIRRAWIRAALWGVGFALLVSALALVLVGCDGVKADDKAPGQPLDAHSVTEYDKPAWLPACDHAYKVVDRQSGQQWWLLVMHANSNAESWVCMPIETR